MGGSRRSPYQSGRLKDGPSDLSTPRARIRRVLGSHQVILPQGPLDSERMARDVSCQGTIGKIDVGMRALVDEGGELNRGHDPRSDPADGTYLGVTGNEHRRLTVCVREDGVGEYAAGGTGGVYSLRGKRGMQFAERA